MMGICVVPGKIQRIRLRLSMAVKNRVCCRVLPACCLFIFIFGCTLPPSQTQGPVSSQPRAGVAQPAPAQGLSAPIPSPETAGPPPPAAAYQPRTKATLPEPLPAISSKGQPAAPGSPNPDPRISPAVLKITRTLKTTRIGTLDFRDEKLSNILKLMTAVSKINFAVKEGSGKGDKIIMPDYLDDVLEEEDSNGNDSDEDLLDTEVSIFLKDVSLHTALEVLCKNNGLRYSVEDGYVLICEKKEDIRITCGSAGNRNIPSDALGFVSEMELKGVTLGRALKALSRQTGVNMVCRPWLENIEVSLSLRNLPLRTAVEVLCKKYNLWYREADETIHLMHAYDLDREVPVEFGIQTLVFNLKYASAPQVADTISSVMGDRVEYILPTQLKSYEHLKLSDLDEDTGTIETQGSDAEASKEIDLPELKTQNLTTEKIGALLKKKLDLKLTATDVRWINRQLGFGLMSIFLRNNAILVSSPDDKILRDIRSIIRQLDTPTPQVLLECRILDVTLTDDFSSVFEISNLEYFQSGRAADDTSTGSRVWRAATMTAAGSGGVQGVYNLVTDKLNLDLTLEMLKENGLVSTVATPMIVAAQNSEAQITSGDSNVPMFSDISYVSPSYDDDGNMTVQGYSSPEYETVDIVGTTLRITPQINEDRSVTLRIYLEQSDFNQGGAEVQYATFDSNGNPNATWSKSTVNTLKKNTIQTIAAVPEGLTLVLGGLIEEQKSVNEQKVPVLGDIPGLGFFFKNEVKTNTRSEMIVLLTPHILTAPTDAGRVTEEILEGTEHPLIREKRKYMLEYDHNTKTLD